jgi:hypothetical protein
MNSDKSPTADVYAGDTLAPGSALPSSCVLHFFDIEADAEPGTFARVANVLNIANTAPHRATLLSKPNDGTLSIYIEIEVGPSMAQSIQRKLLQMTDVVRAGLGIVPHEGTLAASISASTLGGPTS